MRWRHAVVIDQGIEWRVPRAKTDQQGEGKTVGMPRHPNLGSAPSSRSVTGAAPTGRCSAGPSPRTIPCSRPWTRRTDPIHRDPINDIIQRAATRAGLIGDYGSHSPQAGFTTDCIDAGITREHVRHHGRWTNIRSLDPY